MKKVTIGPDAFVVPMPMTLVGAMVEGKPNFMAVAWLTRVNNTPPMVGAAIGKDHHTARGIEENESFSVNFPGVDLIERTDYCGLVSGRTRDKSTLFEVFHGELKTAPMVVECPLCLECRLERIVDLPSNNLYVGEIVGAYTETRYLSEGIPDIQKMNPFVLTMPDNSYWAIGRHAGNAWEAGKAYSRRGKR